MPAPRAARAHPGGAAEEPPQAPRLETAGRGRRPGGPSSSASTNELAQRLGLNPRVIADQLGDASGDIPRPAAERLERAFHAGEAAAKRLDLDELRARTLVSLFTNHALGVLHEEKLAAPGSVPPDRLDEITSESLASIRAACGDKAEAGVKDELAKL